MNVPDLTPAEREEFRDMLQAGARRLSRRRRIRAQMIAGSCAVILVAAIATGSIAAVSGLERRASIAASPTPSVMSPSPVAPEPERASPTPSSSPPSRPIVTPPPAVTPPPTVTPPPAVQEPQPEEQLSLGEVIPLCIDSAGTVGEPTREQLARADVRGDEARIARRPDGLWFVLIPYGTSDIENLELGCLVTPDLTVESVWMRFAPEEDDFDDWATGVESDGL